MDALHPDRLVTRGEVAAQMATLALDPGNTPVIAARAKIEERLKR